jgi:hypothetical protein
MYKKPKGLTKKLAKEFTKELVAGKILYEEIASSMYFAF